MTPTDMTPDAHTTPRPDAGRPEPDRPDAPPKPYAPPALTALGAVGAVTAGPKDGNIDQIAGGTGGFQDPPDTTS